MHRSIREKYDYLAKHTLTLREFGVFITDFESQYYNPFRSRSI